ncbi:MAG: sensor histidine kinase [Roseivirga sp.]|nr:sensor histidine kinase [Roseivirga sp.]
MMIFSYIDKRLALSCLLLILSLPVQGTSRVNLNDELRQSLKQLRTTSDSLPAAALERWQALEGEYNFEELDETEQLLWLWTKASVNQANFIIGPAVLAAEKLDSLMNKSIDIQLSREDKTNMHLTIGDLQAMAFDIPQAYLSYEQAREESRKTQDSLLWWITSDRKVQMLNTLGDYDRMSDQSLELIQLAEALKDNDKIAHSYHFMANALRGISDFDRAERYYQKEIALLETMKDDLAMAFAHSNLAGSYSLAKEHKKSVEHSEISLSILKELGQEFYETGIWISMGRSLIYLGETDKAQQALNKGNQMAQDQQFQEAIVQGMLGNSELLIYEGKLNQAEELLQLALDITYEFPMPQTRNSGLEVLINLYKQRRSFERAFEIQAIKATLEDSLIDVRKQLELAEMEVKYETQKKERALEKNINELVLQKEANRRLLTGLLAVALFVFVLILFYTKIRKARNQLRSQNESLDMLNATKDKFFSIIAHDLRSPMIGLQGVGQKLEYFIKRNRQEKLLEIGGQIDQSIDQLNHLLNNLLNWAVSQTDGIPNHPEVLSTYDLIQENIRLYQSLAESKDIEVICESDHGAVYADRNAFATIVRNLLSNAIKFTRQGGKVNIRTESTDNSCTVSVSDQGPGIDAEQLKAMKGHFSPSKTGSGGEKGFGIGLRLCKELAEMNGGHISIKNLADEGACFSIFLPKTVDSASMSEIKEG